MSDMADFASNHRVLLIGTGAVLILLVAGKYIAGKNPAPNPASSSGTQDLSGLTNGIVYVPTQTTFSTQNIGAQFSNDPSLQSITTGDITTNSPVTVTKPVNPTTPAEPQVQTAYVRGRYSNPQVMDYDKNTPQGVPIRSTAGGGDNVIRYQAYGSSVTIVGASSAGSSNLPGAGGSNEWLPVQGGGFISAYDITGLSSSSNAVRARRPGGVTTS